MQFVKQAFFNQKHFLRNYNVLETEKVIEKLLSHSRLEISKTITLIESSLPQNRIKAVNILKELSLRSDRKEEANNIISSMRIGICGSPGAGKSTFIEKLGISMCEEGRKIAVIAIDPSSQKTGGSLLGDKTRMKTLALHENAFIRPSPSKGILGGIAPNTSELTFLFEKIGFDYIFVETVGIGQSELDIDNVCDLVLYIIPPGAGDELQASKRGIMEISDMIVINKFDGKYHDSCIQAKLDIEKVIDYKPLRYDDWVAPLIICSSLTGLNLYQVKEKFEEFKNKYSKQILYKRYQQNIKNMWKHLALNLSREISDNSSPLTSQIADVTNRMTKEEDYLPYEASEDLIKSIYKRIDKHN